MENRVISIKCPTCLNMGATLDLNKDLEVGEEVETSCRYCRQEIYIRYNPDFLIKKFNRANTVNSIITFESMDEIPEDPSKIETPFPKTYYVSEDLENIERKAFFPGNNED